MRRLLLAFSTVAGLLAGQTAWADPKPETGIHLPFDASHDGYLIDWLIKWTGVFVIILFIIMVAWMFIASLRHGRKHDAEYDHGNSRASIKVALVLSAVIFFVVDGNLWFNSTKDINGVLWNY